MISLINLIQRKSDKRSSRAWGIFYGFCGIFFWSFNVIIAKHFVGVITPIQISFGRWFLAIVLFLPFTLTSIIEHRRALQKHWKLLLALATSGIACVNLFVYIAGETTSAIDMSLLAIIGPLFLIFLSKIFFHIKISKKQIVGLVFVLLGILIIILKGHLKNLKDLSFVIGDLWMLASAFLFAVYGVLQKLNPRSIPGPTLLSVSMILGTLMLLPFFLFQTSLSDIRVLSNQDWLILLYMGIFPSIVSYICWIKALYILGSVRSSLIYYTLPIFSSVEAYFMLGEPLSPFQIYGGFFVLFGVSVASIRAVHDPKIQRA